MFAVLNCARRNGRVLRSDDAVVPATSFWEFPIRTLYREFPESRALRSPQSPRRHAVDRGLGSGSELQELAGGALDLEALIVVRDRPRMRGGGNRHVPQGLDHMSRSLAKRVVFSLVTVMRLPNSPGTRQCPETPSPKRSTSASTISASQIRP